MIKQLQSDKIIVGKAAVFEKQLDELINEQVKLKESEITLMKKVKSASKKADSRAQENSKTMQPVTSHGSLAKSRASSAKGTKSNTMQVGANGLTI